MQNAVDRMTQKAAAVKAGSATTNPQAQPTAQRSGFLGALIQNVMSDPNRRYGGRGGTLVSSTPTGGATSTTGVTGPSPSYGG